MYSFVKFGVKRLTAAFYTLYFPTHLYHIIWGDFRRILLAKRKCENYSQSLSKYCANANNMLKLILMSILSGKDGELLVQEIVALHEYFKGYRRHFYVNY